MDDVDDNDEHFADELLDEIIGSCVHCGGDVCEDEACFIQGLLFCDQCGWWLLHA